ncbi:MAG: cell division protein FtsL [Alphaproteobacteria bacterium]|nr:cell division protein FtsL [Alphaproteobacteria bacterium]
MGIKVRFLFMFVVLFLTGSAVSIYVGHKVRVAEEKLESLDYAYQLEISRMQALEAEYAFLNNPERLEKLAVQYLGMAMPEKIAAVNARDLNDRDNIYVEHLMSNAAYGVRRSQKRSPDYVVEKPMFISAEGTR